MFNELLGSIRDAGKIYRNKKTASRTFNFNEINVKAVREKIGVTQTEFSILIGSALIKEAL